VQKLSPCVPVPQRPISLLPAPSPTNDADSYRSNQAPKQFSGCAFHCLLIDLVFICQCVFHEELGHHQMTAALRLMLNVKDSWVIKFTSLLLPASTLHHPFISRSGSISEVISICPTYFGGLSSFLLPTSSKYLVPMQFYFSGFNLCSLSQ